MMESVILLSFIILIYLVVITKWQCERIILKCCSQKAPRSFQGVGHMLLRGCHCVRLALTGFIFKYLFAPTHVWWLQEEIRGRQKPPCPSSENEVTTLRMEMWATGRCFDTLWGGRRRQQPGCSLWQVSSALLEQWCSPGWQDHSISELQTPPALPKQQAPHKAEGLSLKKEFSYREAWWIHFCWGWVTAAHHCSCFLDVMGFRICVLPSALWLRSGCWATAWQGIA